MKKNLRNILTLALGFVTVIATAQSWDADSRTRVDMGGDNDQFTTEQRISLGASWGGNGWGINVSGNANYDLGGNAISLDWNEAYATTDLMGYATVAIGRQALEYGNGQLIGANDWAANPNTRDGGVFTIANDMMDLDFGIYNNNSGALNEETQSDYFVNASKSDGDWSVNLTYISNTDETNALGLDFGYAMMGGDLDLAVSYNTATDSIDMDFMSLGATYNVNDNISISGTRTTYGDNGFSWGGSNYGDGAASWGTHGNMGYLGANDEDLSLGLTYGSGDFTLGIAMHKVTNANDDTYERNVTEANLNYTMSDNANVGIRYATDNNGTADDTKYMWLTLSVTP
ncbi:MAG: hypothetical protein H8E84_00820 [Flavobacteriales bacterium]|nr:hypothetical protein [Flavobacteriales bacterium]